MRLSLKSPYSVFSLIAASLIILLSVVMMRYGFRLLVAFLLAINLTTFLYYLYDKAMAGSSTWRVPEWVLHGLAFLGGSPAALASQMLLHHKTYKNNFQLIYWLIVIVQVIFVVYLSR